MRTLIVALLAATLLGCIMVVEDRRPDPAPQYMACDEDEVRFVIYREYYCCDPWEISYMRHYRLYYGYDDCDLWFLLFFSRHFHLDLRVVIHRYESCGRRMHVLVRDSGCDPDIFFVRVVDADRCPPPYGRAYGYWKKRQLHAIELSNDEYRALIDLRIGVDYYGHSAETFFARVRANEMPCRVLYREYRDCGKGGRDWSSKAVVKSERPWDMPRERREAWKREVREREDKSHEKFKEEHANKVKEYRADKDKNWRDEDERAPSKSKPTPPPSRVGEERGPSKTKSNPPPSKVEEERGPSKSQPNEPKGKPSDPAPSEIERGPSKTKSTDDPPPSKGKSEAPPPQPKGKSSEPKKEPTQEEPPPSEEKQSSDDDKDKGNKKKK